MNETYIEDAVMVALPVPWEVSKPVRSTTARQPPSGVRMRASLSAPVCCRMRVPPNRICNTPPEGSSHSTTST